MEKSNDFLPSQGSEPQPFAAVIAALLGWLTIYTYMLQAVGIGLQGAASYVCWFSYRVSSIKPAVLVMLTDSQIVNRGPTLGWSSWPGGLCSARPGPPSCQADQPQFLPQPQNHKGFKPCFSKLKEEEEGATYASPTLLPTVWDWCSPHLWIA